MPLQLFHVVRRSIPSAQSARALGIAPLLGALAGVITACDSGTAPVPLQGDRVVPKVSLAVDGVRNKPPIVDSVNVRVPPSFTLNASDATVIQAVVISVLVDGAAVWSDSVATTTKVVSRRSKLELAAVRAGQAITIRARAIDENGNTGSVEVKAVAYDPALPRVKLMLTSGATVFPGGTYTFSVQANDPVGITKIGYRLSGPSALTRSDSSLFSVPLPVNDTVSFSFTVPSSMAIGTAFTVEPFADNRDALRGTASAVTVDVTALGPDTQVPLVYQVVPPRLETTDSIEISARDPDGFLKAVGFIVKDSAGVQVGSVELPLATPEQQIARRVAWNLPTSLRGRGLFVTGFTVDQADHRGYAVPNGVTVAASGDAAAKRDPTTYAFGQTARLPGGSLGADIAVDTMRARVYVSNLTMNELEAFDYGATIERLPSVSVGAQPWGMAIDNSGSFLLVANSGGTNISRVDLSTRTETGRIRTANAYLYQVSYVRDDPSGGYRYTVSAPMGFSERPQHIAQSASGAVYYSTRRTEDARPGTLRRIDNFLDPQAEPRQIWQHGSPEAGKWVILNADGVNVVKGQYGVPDSIIVCDHPVGQDASASQCVRDKQIPVAIAALRDTGANVWEVKDLSVASLALPDTNLVAVGADRRRVAFGSASTGGLAGRVMVVYDPSGTPANAEQYSQPTRVTDLTNNASDRLYGLSVNNNSSNIALHGVETLFADSTLRVQGRFATFNSGAGVAFHPQNVDEETADLSARVVFVASSDYSIQIVDSYSYRSRGRIPIRSNLRGPLRAVLPTAAERASDPTVVVKLFGLTAEGLVMIDVHSSDIR